MNKLGSAKVMTWNELLELGRASYEQDARLESIEANMKPGAVCTLIYTSGTTGNPKAVMISHDNCFYTGMNALCIVYRFTWFLLVFNTLYIYIFHSNGDLRDFQTPTVLNYSNPSQLASLGLPPLETD